MEWHIVTGEYPPHPGGVSDYTYLLAGALAEQGEDVHIWSPSGCGSTAESDGVQVHPLPSKFGLRWLVALARGVPECSRPNQILLVQYVPHMYGWKSMNVAFCCWLALRAKTNLWVMFHEVAFPFKRGQRWRHHVLAIVHRLMAWMILHSANRSFTSTDDYKQMLRRLAPSVPVDMLRIFSNVRFSGARSSLDYPKKQEHMRPGTVGIFSSFGHEIRDLLDASLPALLRRSDTRVLLIGPGEDFIEGFSRKHPEFKYRLASTGRVEALEAGPYFQNCDVLLQLYPEGASLSRGTLMAALASGVPVVTTRGPVTGPLLEDSGAVAFTDPDPHSISETVIDLLADTKAAHNLGAAGRRLYDTHFDIGVTLAVLSEGRLTADTLARSA